MTDWIIPFLCGLGASILSAWGVGGGTLLLLVMTLFLDVDQRTAQGINLLFFLPTAASALVCHARGGYLDKPTLKSAVPLAVAAALAGAWIATNLDVAVLRKPFGVYLLLSGVSLLWPQRRKKTDMTQAAGEALQGFSRGLTMFFHTAPQGRHPALPPRSGSTSGKQGRGLHRRPRPRSLFHRVVQSQRHFHPLPVPPDFHGHLIAHIQLPPDAQQLLTGFHRPAAGGEDEVPLPGCPPGLRRSRA